MLDVVRTTQHDLTLPISIALFVAFFNKLLTISTTISIPDNSTTSQTTNIPKANTTMMNNYKISLAIFAMAAINADAFAPAPAFNSRSVSATRVGSSMSADNFYFMDEKPATESTSSQMQAIAPSKPVSPQKKVAPKKMAAAHGKEGVLSPIVKSIKAVMGDEELNKLRGKVIGMHSELIGNFVATADTPFGQAVLKRMYATFDSDRNGTLEESELEKLLLTLGFSHLNAKQIHGIFDRADSDHDGHVTMEEWMKEAPKTLRTNLIKLAKKNGGDMGLLA
jgi:hypothetical protein